MSDTVANYLPQFLPRTVLKAVVVADDNPTVPYWTWSSGPGYDRSGDQYEYASLRDVNGEAWVFSDAFGNPGKQEWFPMEAVVDLVTRNGTTVDFAASGKVQGCSYLPRDLPSSGEIVIRQWFWLWSAKPENGGVRARPGFWEGRFTFGNTRTNPDFPSLGAIKVIELREVWWDSAAGWVRGHPVTAGELPWNGETPNLNIVVVPEQLDCIGYNVGHLWVGHDGNSSVHLKSIEYGPEPVELPKAAMPDESLLIAALDRNTAAVNALAARLVSLPISPTPSPTTTTPPTPLPPPIITPTPSTNVGGITVHDIPFISGRFHSGAFGADETIAFRFTVPAGFAKAGSGHFGGGYETDQQPDRKSALSLAPGDFTPVAPSVLIEASNTLYLPFYVSPAGDGFYPSLQPGQTYYLNIHNLNLPAGANGAMYLDLVIPH